MNRLKTLMIAAGAMGMMAAAVVRADPPATGPTTAGAEIPDNTVIATVGDQKLTYGQFRDAASNLSPEGQAAAMGDRKQMFARRLVDFLLIAQEGRKQGLDKTDDYKQQMEMASNSVLNRMVMDKIAQSVDEKSAEDYYNQHKMEFASGNFRHILIRSDKSSGPAVPGRASLTDEEAKKKAEQIREKLVAGADFGTLAKEQSDDQGSANNNGELGKMSYQRLVPSFAQAAFALKDNKEISPVVKSEFGYHIIQRIGEIEPAPDFKTMDFVVKQQLMDMKVKELLDAAAKNNPVNYNPAFFGTTQPADAGK